MVIVGLPDLERSRLPCLGKPILKAIVERLERRSKLNYIVDYRLGPILPRDDTDNEIRDLFHLGLAHP